MGLEHGKKQNKKNLSVFSDSLNRFLSLSQAIMWFKGKKQKMCSDPGVLAKLPTPMHRV